MADILKNDGVKNVIIIVKEVEVGGGQRGGRWRGSNEIAAEGEISKIT